MIIKLTSKLPAYENNSRGTNAQILPLVRCCI